MAERRINNNQFNMMKHAIGLDHWDRDGKVFKMTRNRYCEHDSEDWKHLVSIGFATRNRKDGDFYHVTEAGIGYIEAAMGIRIIDQEEQTI